MQYFPKYGLKDLLSLPVQEINILGNLALIIHEEEIEKIKAVVGK